MATLDHADLDFALSRIALHRGRWIGAQIAIVLEVRRGDQADVQAIGAGDVEPFALDGDLAAFSLHLGNGFEPDAALLDLAAKRDAISVGFCGSVLVRTGEADRAIDLARLVGGDAVTDQVVGMRGKDLTRVRDVA